MEKYAAKNENLNLLLFLFIWGGGIWLIYSFIVDTKYFLALDAKLMNTIVGEIPGIQNLSEFIEGNAHKGRLIYLLFLLTSPLALYFLISLSTPAFCRAREKKKSIYYAGMILMAFISILSVAYIFLAFDFDRLSAKKFGFVAHYYRSGEVGMVTVTMLFFFVALYGLAWIVHFFINNKK